MTVTWDPIAATALTEEIDRLEQCSSTAVEKFVTEIRAAMERLDAFPESGRMVPEFGHRQVRETFVGRFRLLYRLHADGVEIGTLWPAVLPLDVDPMTSQEDTR